MATWGSSLMRLARAYAPDGSDADDLMQEIAFSLWRALPTYRGESSERTFVFRVAHNRASSWRRTHGRHRADVDLDEAIPDPSPWIDERLAAAQRSDRLQQMVRRLPDTMRQVVVLRLEGLTDAEIGDVVGISEGNVAVRLTRARKALRILLDGNEL